MNTSVYGIAREGWPLVLVLVAAAALCLTSPWPAIAALPALLVVLAAIKFRDPDRAAPPDALAVLSPIDGVVTDIDRDADGQRVQLCIATFSPYLLRAPTEGKILDAGHGLLIRTDEGDEVVLRLRGPRWLPSAAVIGYGERVGHGQRCGLLRTACRAEIWLPDDAELLVSRGAKVRAGETPLGRFPGNGALPRAEGESPA